MCKYCKHLEEERFLERKDHQRVVDDWKVHCSKQEKLLSRAYTALFLLNDYASNDEGFYETVNKLMFDIEQMLRNCWIEGSNENS